MSSLYLRGMAPGSMAALSKSQNARIGPGAVVDRCLRRCRFLMSYMNWFSVCVFVPNGCLVTALHGRSEASCPKELLDYDLPLHEWMDRAVVGIRSRRVEGDREGLVLAE